MTLDPASAARSVGRINLAAIDAIKLEVVDDAAEQPVRVLLGGVFSVSKTGVYPQGVISLTFDDGWRSQYTLARPAMNRYHFPGTAYIIQDVIEKTGSGSQYMLLSELHELERSGWEIAAHAVTLAHHNAPGAFTSLSPAQLETEMHEMRRWLTSNGFSGADDFSYPQGEYNRSVLAAAKRHFVTARLAAHSALDQPLNLAGDERYKLRVTEMDAAQPLTQLKATVDQARLHGQWVIFMGHQIVPQVRGRSQMELAKFEALLTYIAASGVPVKTVREVRQHLRSAP